MGVAHDRSDAWPAFARAVGTMEQVQPQAFGGRDTEGHRALPFARTVIRSGVRRSAGR